MLKSKCLKSIHKNPYDKDNFRNHCKFDILFNEWQARYKVRWSHLLKRLIIVIPSAFIHYDENCKEPINVNSANYTNLKSCVQANRPM